MSGAILIKALCAILLLAAAPAPAQESGEGNDRGRDGPVAEIVVRARLQLANGDRFTPDAVLIDLSGATGFDPAGARFLDLGDPVEQRDENKLDLGGFLGMLGLGQDTTSSEFQGAARFGDVFQIGNFVVVEPLPGIDGEALAASIKTTVIANQGVSFLIGGIYGSVDEQAGKVPFLSDIPLLGTMFRYRVGDAHLKNDSLLILVTPHLVDLD